MAHTVWALVIASGKDQQLPSGADVPFLSLEGQPVIAHSLAVFERCPDVANVIIVAPKERMLDVQGMIQLLGFKKVRKIVAGATQRFASMRAGLDALDEEVTLVVVHEASRPCITLELVAETVKAARKSGAAVCACPIPDALKECSRGRKISNTIKPNTLWTTQTPGVYKVSLLAKALDAARKRKDETSDEVSAVVQIKGDVWIVPSTPRNMKILSPQDLVVATALLHL